MDNVRSGPEDGHRNKLGGDAAVLRCRVDQGGKARDVLVLVLVQVQVLLFILIVVCSSPKSTWCTGCAGGGIRI